MGFFLVAVCYASVSHKTMNPSPTAGPSDPPSSKGATSASLCKHCSLDSKFNLGKGYTHIKPCCLMSNLMPHLSYTGSAVRGGTITEPRVETWVVEQRLYEQVFPTEPLHSLCLTIMTIIIIISQYNSALTCVRSI